MNSEELVELNSLDRQKPQRETFSEGSFYNPAFEELIEVVTRGNTLGLKELLQKQEFQAAVNCQDAKGSTLLHIAAEKRDADCIQILLSRGANPNISDDIDRKPIHWVLDGGCRCEFCTKKNATCLQNLIDGKANVNAEDNNKETPLYYAAKHQNSKCASILLANGADLTHRTQNQSLAALLVQHIPDVMKQEFDKCIRFDVRDNSKLMLDFRLILQAEQKGNDSEKGYKPIPVINRSNSSFKDTSIYCCAASPPRETELLHCVLKGNIGDSLLTHPLTEAFLHLKWMSVRKYFWFIRSFYFAFASFYTIFVFNLYIHQCPYDFETNGPKSFAESPFNTFKCQPSIWSFILACFIGSTAVIMMIYELYKMCHDATIYFKEELNYAWWILIFSTTLTIIPVLGIKIEQWQYPLASFTIIYTWTMTMSQVARTPDIGLYVEMLGKVMKDFVLFFMTYSALITAFALGFCILLPDHEVFYSIPLSYLKVLLMMVGDVDYFRVFNTMQNERLTLLEYTIPAHLIYAGFIIIMTIVLSNMLVGLAVNDIQELQKQAAVRRSIKLVNEIYILESLTHNNVLFCGCASYIAKLFSVTRLNYMEGYYLSFSPTDPNDNALPKNIKKNFIPYLTSSPCMNKIFKVRPAIVIPMKMRNGTEPVMQRTQYSGVELLERKQEQDGYVALLLELNEVMQQHDAMRTRLETLTYKVQNLQQQR